MTDRPIPHDNGKRVLRVFLAEDDREMRRMIAGMLRADGHFVLEAKDGPSLLLDMGHVFTGDPPDRTPSLVITDVNMPGHDGLAILRRMRDQVWCPPFILITAFGDPSLHESARSLGAHAILDKPFDLAVLRTMVASIACAHSSPHRAWA